MNRHDPRRREDDRPPQDGEDPGRQFSPRGLGDDPARGRDRAEHAPGRWDDGRGGPRWSPRDDPWRSPLGHRDGAGSHFASYEDRGPTESGRGFDDREAFQRHGRGDRTGPNDLRDEVPGPWRPRDYRGPEPYPPQTSTARRGPHAGLAPMNYTRSDHRIYEDICEALTAHDEVDPSRVEVQVAEGVVTLRGAVDDRAMRRRVEEVIDAVPGVRDVVNDIKVQRGGGDARERS